MCQFDIFILYLYLEPNLSASLGPPDICGVKGNLKVRLVMWNGGGANSVTEDITNGKHLKVKNI